MVGGFARFVHGKDGGGFPAREKDVRRPEVQDQLKMERRCCSVIRGYEEWIGNLVRACVDKF